MTEIAARSATEIKDRIRRVALYSGEECRIILADIVGSRTLPKIPRKPIIKRDCRFAKTPNLFRLSVKCASSVIDLPIAPRDRAGSPSLVSGPAWRIRIVSTPRVGGRGFSRKTLL